MNNDISDLAVLYRILDRPTVEKILLDKFGFDSKSIVSGGWELFDDLDQVEFLMEMEKSFDIGISDDLAEHIFNNITLSDFLSGIVSYNRNERLKELGI